MPRIGQDVSLNAAGDALGGDAQWSESQLTDYLTQQYRANPGMQIPTGFKLANGKIVTDKTFFQRHSWIVPLLFGAGGAAAGVATGAIDLGALAAGGPAAASTTIGSTSAGTGAAGTAAGLGPSTAANMAATTAATATPAGIAAGTGGSVAGTAGGAGWATKLGSAGWANIISGGAQAAGAVLQYKANNKATDAEAQAAKDALDFLKARDARDYADQAPYRSLGANSANTLASIMGQGTNNAPPNPLPATPNAIPPGQPFPSSWVPGSPFAPGGAQSVVMVAPNGEEKAVPLTEVAHWTKLGAKPKGAAAAPAMPPPAQGRDLGSVIGGGI